MSYVNVPPKRYRVHLHSKPGLWNYYEGYKDVWAYGEAFAMERAIRKMNADFKDRPDDAWVIDRVEEI